MVPSFRKPSRLLRAAWSGRIRDNLGPPCMLRGGNMKGKAILAVLAACLATAAISFAEDAFSGTWKLNEAKSKLSSGMNKNTTVTYAASGDSVKITLDGVG